MYRPPPPLPTLPSGRSISYSRSNRRLVRDSDLSGIDLDEIPTDDDEQSSSSGEDASINSAQYSMGSNNFNHSFVDDKSRPIKDSYRSASSSSSEENNNGEDESSYDSEESFEDKRGKKKESNKVRKPLKRYPGDDSSSVEEGSSSSADSESEDDHQGRNRERDDNSEESSLGPRKRTTRETAESEDSDSDSSVGDGRRRASGRQNDRSDSDRQRHSLGRDERSESSDESSLGDRRRRRATTVKQNASNIDQSSSDESSLGDRRRTVQQNTSNQDEGSSDESSLGDRRKQHSTSKQDESSSDESSLGDRRRTVQQHSSKFASSESDASSFGDRRRALSNSKPKSFDEDLDESFLRACKSKPSGDQYQHEMSEDLNESIIGAVGDSTTKQNGTVKWNGAPSSSFDYDYSSPTKQANDSAMDAATKRLLKIKVHDESYPQNFTIISVEVDTTSRQQSATTADDLIVAVLNVGQAVQINQRDNVREDEVIVEPLPSYSDDAEENSRDGKPESAPSAAERLVPPDLSQLEPISKSKLPTSHVISEPPAVAVEHHLTPDASQLEQTSKVASPIPTKAPTKVELPKPGAQTFEPSNNGIDPFIIPTIVTAAYVKSTPDQKVGLSFRKSKGVVIIEKISPGSALDGSQLKSGQECLCINGHRIRSARRAAEVVRETDASLTIMVSTAPRPPGTSYTVIQLGGENNSGDEAAGGDTNNISSRGMTFEMKHGLVQLTKVDSISPITNSSIKRGDYILAINGVITGSVENTIGLLSEASMEMVPILYFNLRHLRMSLVNKVLDESWKREWSDSYDECVVLPPTGNSNPVTLRFRENGSCVLIDPLRAFRVMKFGHGDSASDDANSIPADHPLHAVVDTLNIGISCVLEAIRQGVHGQ